MLISRNHILAAAVVIATALVAVGCGEEASSPAAQSFEVTIEAVDTDIPEATIEGVTIKNVRAFNVINSPGDLPVRQGTKVTVTLINKSPISENLSIDVFGVDVTVKPGETATFAFDAEEVGSFQIWCKLHPRNIHLPGTLSVVR